MPRLNIGVFGIMNAGKSTLMNAITRQQTSIVDATPGTTAGACRGVGGRHNAAVAAHQPQAQARPACLTTANNTTANNTTITNNIRREDEPDGAARPGARQAV